MFITTPRAFMAGAALALFAGPMAAQAVEKLSPKAVSPASSTQPGYTVAPVPGWVKPLTVEATPGLAPAPLQVLLMDRQTRVTTGASTERFVHYVRQVNDAAGLQKGAQIELEFDPSFQKLVLHQLDVVRGTQRIDKRHAGVVKLLHREQQLERQIVNGRMTASVVLDDLRVGDRVEWAASLVGDNPVFGAKFADQEWMSASLGPVGLASLRLQWPAGRAIKFRVSEPSIEVSESQQSGVHELRLTRRNIPQFQFDPLLPPLDYVRDLVEISEFQDWGEVAAWAEQLFAKSTQTSAAIAARADEIARSATTAEQRLRLALDFVQRDVRYFGTEIGASSHQPALAETVLRQRFGDCKDKSSLFVALLRRFDIAATPVLVPTYLRAGVATRLPSPLVFDHVIVAVPQSEGQTLWLDSTRSQQTGEVALRQSLGLGFGLLARSDVRELSALPTTAGHVSSETDEVFSFPRLADEGRLTSTTTYHGDSAEVLREAKSSLAPAEFERGLVADLARLYPGFTQLGAPKYESLDEFNAVRITQTYRTGNFWRLLESRSLVGETALSGLMAPLRLSTQSPRREAMRLPTPGRHLQRLRLEFGEEVYAAGGKQTSFDERNDQFQLQLRYQTEPRSLSIEGELTQTATTLPAGQWARYREQLTRLWPRLSPQISVPLLAPSQLNALRGKLNQLDDQMRSGSVRTYTQQQVRARSRLLVLDEQLATGRLPDKPRAQLLVERGQQLDHLGENAAAQRAFEAAMVLDPESSDAPAALAVNALIRGQDGQAITQAEKALQLGDRSSGPRFTRAWARYLSGAPAAARDELREILQSQGTERERGYAGIWFYLANRRAGTDNATALQDLSPQVSTSDKTAWPYPVLRLMRGEIDLEAALKASRSGDAAEPGQLCELYFYAAQLALLDGATDRAKELLRKSLATHVVEFNEHAMAGRELQRLVSTR